MHTPCLLSKNITAAFSMSLNANQLRDIERLIYEILARERTSTREILEEIERATNITRAPHGSRFFILKEALIKRRFPQTSKHQKIHADEVFLNQVRSPLTANRAATIPFRPEKIFIERAVNTSKLAARFVTAFPGTPVEEIKRYADYLRQNKFRIELLKQPLVFIVKEKWDFIKPCPCTKDHTPCGYWIFNIGFGCPFDCSYCFLQQYANFPGMILPANLEDFFRKFEASGLSTLKKPVRIGTGEFCDSLALDPVTEYSKDLIPFFGRKNVLFELKTKSDAIDNLLSMRAPGNIVISWSLNPDSIAQKEEVGAANLDARLRAAAAAQKHGYRIGFHFDPIIHADNWENLYRQTVRLLYASVKPPLAWISLGTLRCHRELKARSQMRFPQSGIFFGELLLGADKKLRYPHFIRKEIYGKMYGWIRSFDKKTPVYLCMEDKEMWQVIGKQFTSAQAIEDYLIPMTK